MREMGLLRVLLMMVILSIGFGNKDVEEMISSIKECYDQSAVKREGSRKNINPRFTHNKGDSLVKIYEVLDDIDVSQIGTLSECIKTVEPTKFEDRKFDQDANKYGGGNDVIFLTGLLPIILPSLSKYIVELASAASEEAGWRPHVSHLGFRCIEKLMYYPGGELLYHVDHGSIYTLVIILSDENDFIGGEFQIINADRSIINYKAPKKGGMLFDSNKDHGITTIKEGERHVLVVEFWPFEDTNASDRRPHEENHNFKMKVPQLLEVPKQHYCPSK